MKQIIIHLIKQVWILASEIEKVLWDMASDNLISDEHFKEKE